MAIFPCVFDRGSQATLSTAASDASLTRARMHRKGSDFNLLHVELTRQYAIPTEGQYQGQYNCPNDSYRALFITVLSKYVISYIEYLILSDLNWHFDLAS